MRMATAASAVESRALISQISQRRFRVSAVQLGAWAVLVSCGVIEAWWTRHRIFSDGISYLDIAANYARRDWRHALNEYWSPLYSWVLAAVFRLFSPPPYWQVAVLHAVNFAGFCAALCSFELFLMELLRDRPGNCTLSDTTVRIAGYVSLFIAGLWYISLGQVSPDMIAMAILFFLAFLQLRIHTGRAGNLTCVFCGAALGLAFLARSAFVPVAAVYVPAMAMSLRMRNRPVWRPVLLVCAALLLVCGPFVAAVSVVKGHFTLGSTGASNYAWEVDGAPRSVHWQGQPPELGVPEHPTRKLFDHPAVYEFATPVPGTYPPWYEPSYWYAGLRPRFHLYRQLRVLRYTIPYLAALFLACPIALPCLALLAAGGRREWLRRNGILRYWFLWGPMLVYAGLYALVFIDKRYVGAPLVILWICLATSVGRKLPPARRLLLNRALQLVSILFAVALIPTRLGTAISATARDIAAGGETEHNLQAMLAARFHRLGVKAGDRIAYIGNAMDADWARQLGARVVAEVPVIWDRHNSLSRVVMENYAEVDAFWAAPKTVRAHVLDLFRKAGASIVVAGKLPRQAQAEGWKRVIPPGTPYLPSQDGQFDAQAGAGYLMLSP